MTVQIEMTCLKGMNSKRISKTFKSQEAFEKWLDKNEGDVTEVFTREVEVSR